MKQLVILRGAMCSGKSTWVHENELEEYTLSPDHIRVLSGAMGKRDINGHYTAEVKADRPVFKIIMDMLEQRMKKGQFTVIDATHGTERSINAYRELCKKYGYRAYVVDFRVDADTLKSRLEERNRESHGSLENNKYIPEYALDYKIKQLESHKIPSWVTVLSPDNAIQKLSWQFKELGNRTLYAFGDIHSSYRVLKEAWDKLGLENNKEDLIVFCGDYFDRGMRPVETFKFLYDKIMRPNVVMLIGNHDYNLYNLVNKTNVSVPHHTRKQTYEKLIQGGVSVKAIKDFTRRLQQGMFLKDNLRNPIYITHGGILPVNTSDPLALNLIPTSEMIYGSGKFEDDIDSIVNTSHSGFQGIFIHGHRNLHHGHTCNITKGGISFNLEQGCEDGESLAVYRNGLVDTFKNTEFNLSAEDKQWARHQYEISVLNNPKEFLALAKRNKHLLVKPVAPDVYSVNFTSDAFKKGIWDNMTVRSRGLFINDQDNEVYARGYDKFFKISELGGWNKCGLEGHVDMYKKYNGFLGLLTWDKQKGEPVVMSKSKVADGTSKYADLAKTVIMSQLKNIDNKAIHALLFNKTALFEVVDELNDPSHIVHNFDKPTAVLLDVVYNDLVFKKVDYENLKNIAKALGVPVKEKLGSTDTGYQKQAQECAEKQHELEGIVIEDESGTMVKAKTNLYNVIKGMRGNWDYALHHYVATEKLEEKLNECLGYKYDVMGNAKESKKLEQDLVKALMSEYYLSNPENSILNIRKKYRLLGA